MLYDYEQYVELLTERVYELKRLLYSDHESNTRLLVSQSQLQQLHDKVLFNLTSFDVDDV